MVLRCISRLWFSEDGIKSGLEVAEKIIKSKTMVKTLFVEFPI